MSARKVIGCKRSDGGAGCSTSMGCSGSCSGCHQAIYEQDAPPPAFACKTSHYHACDCREHKVAVLIKSALDAARELEQLPRTPLNTEYMDRVELIVGRIYASCEVLGIDISGGTTGQGAFAVADPRAMHRGKGDAFLTGGHYGVVP